MAEGNRGLGRVVLRDDDAQAHTVDAHMPQKHLRAAAERRDEVHCRTNDRREIPLLLLCGRGRHLLLLLLLFFLRTRPLLLLLPQ